MTTFNRLFKGFCILCFDSNVKQEKRVYACRIQDQQGLKPEPCFQIKTGRSNKIKDHYLTTDPNEMMDYLFKKDFPVRMDDGNTRKVAADYSFIDVIFFDNDLKLKYEADIKRLKEDFALAKRGKGKRVFSR